MKKLIASLTVLAALLARADQPPYVRNSLDTNDDFAALTLVTNIAEKAAQDATNGFSAGVAWGDITGTLSAQTDLQSELNAKQASDSDLTSWAAVTRASGFDTFATTPTVANLGATLSDETTFGLAALQSPSTLVSNNFTPVMTFSNRVYFTNGATGNWGFNEGDSHFESNRVTGATFYTTNGVHYWTNGASFRIESASGDTNSGGFRGGGAFTTAAGFEVYRTLAEALARTTSGRKISADASGLYLPRDLFLTLTASVDGTDAQTTSAAGIFLHRGAAAAVLSLQTNAVINAGSLPFPALTIVSTNPTTLAITDSSGTNNALVIVSNLQTTAGILWQGGGNLTNTYTATATLDFANLAAIGCEDLTITVTGAALGDAVSLGIPNGSVVNNGQFTAWVSSADTVTVRFCTLVAGDPASGTFRASVQKWK